MHPFDAPEPLPVPPSFFDRWIKPLPRLTMYALTFISLGLNYRLMTEVKHVESTAGGQVLEARAEFNSRFNALDEREKTIDADLASTGTFTDTNGAIIWTPHVTLSDAPTEDEQYALDYLDQIDLDADRVFGFEDRCPDIEGDETNHGCPPNVDKDGDGVGWYDACKDTLPTDQAHVIATLGGKKHLWDRNIKAAKYEGCADADGDGVPDSIDLCNGDKGSMAFLGCIQLVDTCTNIVSQTDTRATYDGCKAALTMKAQVDCAFSKVDGKTTYSDCK